MEEDATAVMRQRLI